MVSETDITVTLNYTMAGSQTVWTESHDTQLAEIFVYLLTCVQKNCSTMLWFEHALYQKRCNFHFHGNGIREVLKSCVFFHFYGD